MPGMLGDENLKRIKLHKDELDHIRLKINDQESSKALI